MRAVKSRAWQPAEQPAIVHHATYQRPTPRKGGAAKDIRPWVGFGFAFLLGYLPGITLGRGAGFGVSILAEHYMDKQTFADFGAVFTDLFAGAFLQATILLLCGFCALGLGLMTAFFALKGMYLGFCAASVFAVGGAKSLVIHWLLTCLPDIGLLLVMLSLAACGAPLSFCLLRTALGSSTSPGNTYALSRACVLRYLLAVAIAALCCGLGAGTAVFLADILL